MLSIKSSIKIYFMKQFYILFFLFLGLYVVPSNSNAQTLKGSVKDKQGNEIPFAKVRVVNSSYGTVANALGVYQLELKEGTYILDFISPGFQNKRDTLHVSQNRIHHVVLQDDVKDLEEVTVVFQTKRERGKEIMKEVIEKRSYYQSLIESYSCDTYCFSALEKGKLDSIQKDSIIGKEKLNILEWRAKSFVEAPNRFKDEFYAYNDFTDVNREMGGVSFEVQIDGAGNLAPIGQGGSKNPYLFVNGIKEAHFSLLDNTIHVAGLTQNPLISPLAFNAMLYYAFYLEQTISDSTGKMMYEIRVRPKFQHEALFEGTLYIEDNSWRLLSYDLAINPGVLLYFKDMHITADYEKIGERIIPNRKDFVYTIKEGKTLIYGVARVRHQEYSFEKHSKPAKFWLESSTFSADAFDKDSSYWRQNRPFSLNDVELKFIREQDSIITYHESDDYLRKRDSIRNKISFLGVMFNGIGHVNSFKRYSFTINPLIAQVVPFGVGGYRHRLQVDYKKEFENGKYFTIRPEIDYGFLNKDIKGGIGASYMFDPLHFTKFGFELGDVYDFVTSNQNIQGTFAPSNRVRNKKMEVNFSRELVNGLYLKSKVLFSDRKSIDSLKYPSWISYFGNFQQAQTFNPYRIFLTTVELEYHFRQKYYIRKNKKVVLGSPWPIVNLVYKKGIPSLFGAQANFDFLELQLKDEIKLNSFGNAEIKLRAGSFLRKQDLRVIEHTFFRPSDRLFFSNPVNTLQLLDTALNTSNSYVQFNFIHHFNGFFLNKIWLLNRLKLEETIGGGMLYIPDAKFAQVEFYAGLERKVRIRKSLFKVGVYAVTQENSFSKASVNFKVGFNFYNSFTDKWDY
jgi:hypothetical protein